jgi:hypothetical protein
MQRNLWIVYQTMLALLFAATVVIAAPAGPTRRPTSSPRQMGPKYARPMYAPASTAPVGTSPSAPRPSATGIGSGVGGGPSYYQRPAYPMYGRTEITIENISDIPLVFLLRPAYGQWTQFTLPSGMRSTYSNAAELIIDTNLDGGGTARADYNLNSGGYYLLGWNYDYGRFDVFLPY